MATTPCPHCAAQVPVPGDAGDEAVACPACGGRMRFVEAPERPCDGCGASLVLVPGEDVVACGGCGLLQAREAGRGVRVEVRCPRCRRRLEVPWDAVRWSCPHCGVDMVVEQA